MGCASFLQVVAGSGVRGFLDGSLERQNWLKLIRSSQSRSQANLRYFLQGGQVRYLKVFREYNYCSIFIVIFRQIEFVLFGLDNLGSNCELFVNNITSRSVTCIIWYCLCRNYFLTFLKRLFYTSCNVYWTNMYVRKQPHQYRFNDVFCKSNCFL